ncbi:SpoIIE family protein phosphatase [Streptomyces sp. NPDC059506]|uniref:SpoIIE family protein phosphatase n=1 Tax=Streptomyces sp. NPDC059506 TaxID=3347751 RepID=UPI0036C6FE07
MGRTDGSASSGLALEVFDPAPVAVAAVLGPLHLLAYTNADYRKVFGARPLGVPLREAFSDLETREYFSLFDRVFAEREGVRVEEAPVVLARADGTSERHFFTFSLSPLTTRTGEDGVLVVAVETTRQTAAAERIRVLSEERRRALQRYRSLVTAGAQVVWVSDADGRFVEPSPGWQRVTGQTWEEYRGDGWTEAIHPQDREAARRAQAEALERLPDVFRWTYRLRTADGGYRHFAVRAVPIRENGAVAEWVGTCTDVEEQWRRDRREEILARAAAAVTETMRVQDAFAALGRVIVPDLADECAVYLALEPGDPPPDRPVLVERVAAVARDGLPPELPPRRTERFPPDSAPARAVRERRPVRAAFPPGAVPPGTAPRGSVPWLTAASAHGMALLPVVVDGVVTALVSTAVCGDRDPLGEEDVELMLAVLERAHGAVSGALRLQRAQRVALALQRSLLTEPPRVPGVEIAARYLPSPAAAEVGGDWYDSFVLPCGDPVLIIGDVTGHDVEAAVTMGRLRNMLRALAVDRREELPGEVLRRLDLALRAMAPGETTATCTLARVERSPDGGRRLVHSAAGHPPPLLVTGDGNARLLAAAHGPLLGVLPDVPRGSSVDPLPPGSTLLLYTDGLVERPGEDIDEGLARLLRHAAGLAREPVEAFCDELLVAADPTGHDDIAVIALRLPEGPRTAGDPAVPDRGGPRPGPSGSVGS